MEVRVEGFAHRLDGLQAFGLAGIQQLTMDPLEALDHAMNVREAVLRLQGTVEAVQHGKQLAEQGLSRPLELELQVLLLAQADVLHVPDQLVIAFLGLQEKLVLDLHLLAQDRHLRLLLGGGRRRRRCRGSLASLLAQRRGHQV